MYKILSMAVFVCACACVFVCVCVCVCADWVMSRYCKLWCDSILLSRILCQHSRVIKLTELILDVWIVRISKQYHINSTVWVCRLHISLDAPAHAPGWHAPVYAPGQTDRVTPGTKPAPDVSSTTVSSSSDSAAKTLDEGKDAWKKIGMIGGAPHGIITAIVETL